MSKIGNRQAVIAVSETEKKLGNRTSTKVEITIERILPIVTYTPASVSNRMIKSTTNATLLDTEIINTLSAEYVSAVVNGVETLSERFDYIGYANSAITMNSVRFYYDNKYNDVIVIPNTEFEVLDGGVSDNAYINISGYAIGSITNKLTGVFSELVCDINVNNRLELPKFNNNIAIKTDIVNLPGVAQSTSVRDSMLGIVITPDVYLERQGSDKTIILNLGAATNALLNVTDRLPLYAFTQYNTKYNTARYLGVKTVPTTVEIGVVLDF